MSILWMEGFDQYTTTDQMLQGVWSGRGAANVEGLTQTRACTGRQSYKCENQLQGLRRALPGALTGVGVGMHIFHDRLPSPGTGNVGGLGANTIVLCQFRDGTGRNSWSFCLSSAGKLEVLVGGNMDRYTLGWERPPVFGRSTLGVAAGTWNHYEFYLRSDQTAGRVEARINGKVAYVFDGDTVTSTEDDTITEVAFGNFVLGGDANGIVFWDNVFCWTDDDAATFPDNVHGFVGIREVYYQRPIADILNDTWELTSGSAAWPLVDDLDPDDDASYVFSATVGDLLQLEVEPLPSNIVAVTAVSPITRVRTSEIGPCEVRLGATTPTAGTISGDSLAVTSHYTYQYSPLEKDADGDAFDHMDLPFLTIERTV